MIRSYKIPLKSQTDEVAAYYANTPRGPLFPPVTVTEVENVERTIGRRLPELLRRIYTEVANGGFAMIHIASVDNLARRITDETTPHLARSLLGHQG